MHVYHSRNWTSWFHLKGNSYTNLSIVCVTDLAPINSNGQYSEAVQKKLKELIEENSPIKIKIVEYSEEDGSYKIEVPEVRAILIKHGLV